MSVNWLILKFMEYYIYTKDFKEKNLQALEQNTKRGSLSYMLWSRTVKRWVADTSELNICKLLQSTSKMQVAVRMASLMYAEDRILTLDLWRFSESFSDKKNKGFYRRSQLRHTELIDHVKQQRAEAALLGHLKAQCLKRGRKRRQTRRAPRAMHWRIEFWRAMFHLKVCWMVKNLDVAHKRINTNLCPINLKPHTKTDNYLRDIGCTVTQQLNSDYL